MSTPLTEHETIALFEWLQALSQKSDTQGLQTLYRELAAKGAGFKLVSKEDVAFHANDGKGYPYTEVIQKNRLHLGKHVVAKWETTYHGRYSRMGSGWGIGEHGTTMDSGLGTLLKACGIEVVAPTVPEPTLHKRVAG